MHGIGVHRERAQEFLLALVAEHREVDVVERPAVDFGECRFAADRRDARVCVLHVVDGILHRLLGHHVEVERLGRVDALEQERHARDVGIDAIEDVGQRDDVPGPSRHPHLAPVLDDLDELAEDDLGLPGREPERLHAGLQRLHLAVVVGAPDVDQVRRAPPELVAVVREIIGEIRRRAVAPHEHPVSGVAEVCRAQPPRTVTLVHVSAGLQLCEHVDDFALLVQRTLGEPRVEEHSDACQILLQQLDDPPVPPLARLVDRDIVTELVTELFGQVNEVLALVAVLGWCLSPITRIQRCREEVELGSRVVEVVLPVYLRALCSQQVRDGIADRDPSSASRMQRTCRICGHELQVDAPAGEYLRATELFAGLDDLAEHVVQPGGSEEQVDEARSRNLHLGHMRNGRLIQGVLDLLRDVERRAPQRLGKRHRDRRVPVALVTTLRGLHCDALLGFRQPSFCQRLGDRRPEGFSHIHFGCGRREGSPANAAQLGAEGAMLTAQDRTRGKRKTLCAISREARGSLC